MSGENASVNLLIGIRYVLILCADQLPMWLVDALRCLAYCEFLSV